jgi:hypothetical protein
VLELNPEFADAESFLELPAVGANGKTSCEPDKLALTTFTSELARQHPTAIDVSFCVFPATKVKVSVHHMLYTSSAFNGYSGGAVVLAKDGTARGIHLETVNKAKEKLQHGEVMHEIVESINSLISSSASGFIALRLDVQEVQDYIHV